MREQLLWTTVQVLAAVAGIAGVPLAVWLVRHFRAIKADFKEHDRARLDVQERRRLQLAARRAALHLDDRAE